MKKVDLCLVGGSAGSLIPFRTLLEDMKKSSLNNTAVVLFQHLAADATSMMKNIMEGATDWKVVNIESKATIHPRTVYLNSPGVGIILKNGRIELGTPNGKSVSPISDFWETAVDDFENYRTMTTILLSGGGTDGSKGAQKLYKKGALVLVQSPEEAEITSMPKNLIDGGQYHYECYATEMAAVIETFERDSDVIQKIISVGDIQQTNRDVREILQKTFSDVRLNVEWYRLETLVRGLRNRKETLKYRSNEEYFSLLLESKKERSDLLGALLISYTEFFRDIEYFEYIRDLLLDVIGKSEKEELRIWSVGCSTGEEAYSLAMLICDLLEKKNIKKEIKLFATDINESHIATCRKAEYAIEKLEKIPVNYHKYLNIVENKFYITEQVKNTITFASHNCLTTHGFPRMDMVSCRNVMIYFKRLFQDRILESLTSCLNIGGHLFLGMSESLPQDIAPYFESVRVPGSIYKKEKTYLGKLELLKTVDEMPVKSVPKILDQVSRKNIGVGRDATQELLAKYIKRGVLMDRDGKLVGFHGDPGRFFPSMSIDLHVHEMALPELSSLMVTGLQVALKQEGETVYENVNCPGAGETVRLIFSTVGSLKEFIFLEIETQKDKGEKEAQDNVSQKKRDYVKDLETEILSLKDESSQKEQKFVTLNEEFRLQNEELISGNEELQASNEEIKSINTELNIVNKELELNYRNTTKKIQKVNGILEGFNCSFLLFNEKLELLETSPEIGFGITQRDLGKGIRELFSSDQMQKIDSFLEKLPSSGFFATSNEIYIIEANQSNEGFLLLFQKVQGQLESIYKRSQNSEEILPILSKVYRDNKKLIEELSKGNKLSDYDKEIHSYDDNLSKIQKILGADFGSWGSLDLYTLIDGEVAKALDLEVSKVRGNSFKSIAYEGKVPQYYGPKERLGEIFFHFLENSSKFNQKVQGNIGISNIEKGEKKDKVTVTIEDNGIGIPGGELDAIRTALSEESNQSYANLVNIKRYLKYFMDGGIEIKSDGLKNVSVTLTFELERKE
ncbi:MAG: CheR family methyltransferase [Bdellovibrionota bacterium]|nr:CheR family methyltransferase [Bdellovibrionota bacterium]